MSTEALLAERTKTHGKYSDHANLAQGLKCVLRWYQRENYKVLSSEHQEALDMILHKIGRIVAGDPNIHDHWDDIAGYATLASKSINDIRRQTASSGETKKECTCQSPSAKAVSSTGQAGWETAKQA